MSISTSSSAHGTLDSSPTPRAWSRAASLLLVGGVLAFIATFMPFATAVYPNYPTSVIVSVPAQQLEAELRFNLQYPANSSIVDTLFWAFFLWGAPIVLAMLGAALLMLRHRILRTRTWVVSLVLVIGLVPALLGAGYTLLSIEFTLHPFFGSQGWMRSLDYGAIVEVAEYVCTLVALVWLLSLSRRARLTR